jgi:RNA polymerase sigma factor (sigma-70 family)
MRVVLPTADYQLVRAAHAGDRAALGMLLQRHRLMALSLCRRLLKDDALAEDAVQEASLEALLHITRLRKPGRFGAWLAGIALNICRSWLRERAHESWSWEAMLGGQYLPGLSSSADPEEVAIEADLAHRVQAAVAQLPPSQREAVTLFYLSGLTYQEMTTALGIRLGAVKARLNKGRKTLRTKLLEELEGIGLTTEQEAHPVAMRVVDVRRSTATSEEKERFCVLLQEVDGERMLPIWIGTHEGTAIAIQLENVAVPRPHTYAFLANVLRAAGAQLIEARINRLDAEVFYAIAKVTSAGGQLLEVDARPSDVINLAMLTGAPILVDPSVLRAAPQSERARAIAPLTDENSAGAAVIAKEAKANWTSPTQK